MRHWQISAGLGLLQQERLRNTAPVRQVSPTLSRKQQKLRKRQSNEQLNALAEPVPTGIFDDANMKLAIDWLMKERGLVPDVIFDQRQWEEAKGDDMKVFHAFPKPHRTLIFTLPLWAGRQLVSLVGRRRRQD